MIAIDTNILVYAHRKDSEWHEESKQIIKSLAETEASWVIASHALIEFYSIVTHPRIYLPPSSPLQARNQIMAWLACPSLTLANTSQKSIENLFSQAEKKRIVGSQIHDLRIATDCEYAGSEVLWSADRDMSRVSGIKVENPLIK